RVEYFVSPLTSTSGSSIGYAEAFGRLVCGRAFFCRIPATPGLYTLSLHDALPILWQIVLETDMENRGVTARESLEKMAKTWRAMVEASDAYAGQRRSHSGLAGGQGEQMREHAARGGTIGGGFTAPVIDEALPLGESNV